MRSPLVVVRIGVRVVLFTAAEHRIGAAETSIFVGLYL